MSAVATKTETNRDNTDDIVIHAVNPDARFGSFDLVVKYEGLTDINAIAADADYSVEDKHISHTDLHSVCDQKNEIVIRCYLELDLTETEISAVVQELDYEVTMNGEGDLPTEIVDFNVDQ